MARPALSWPKILRHLWPNRRAEKIPFHVDESEYPEGKYDPRFDFIRLNISQIDRGAALLLVAALDVEITNYIKAALIDDKKLLGDLFSETGALGALATKIRLGYLLGLYGEKAFRDLVSISRIRNEFAHNHAAWDFDYQRIKDLTNQIAVLERARESKDQLVSITIQGIDSVFNGKDMTKSYFRFTATVAFLISVFSYVRQNRTIRTHTPLI